VNQARAATLPLSVTWADGVPDLTAWWESATMEERRTVIGTVLDRVTVESDRAARDRLKADLGDGWAAVPDKLAEVQRNRISVALLDPSHDESPG
jgi:hypothetical protein